MERKPLSGNPHRNSLYILSILTMWQMTSLQLTQIHAPAMLSERCGHEFELPISTPHPPAPRLRSAGDRSCAPHLGFSADFYLHMPLDCVPNILHFDRRWFLALAEFTRGSRILSGQLPLKGARKVALGKTQTLERSISRYALF